MQRKIRVYYLAPNTHAVMLMVLYKNPRITAGYLTSTKLLLLCLSIKPHIDDTYEPHSVCPIRSPNTETDRDI